MLVHHDLAIALRSISSMRSPAVERAGLSTSHWGTFPMVPSHLRVVKLCLSIIRRVLVDHVSMLLNGHTMPIFSCMACCLHLRTRPYQACRRRHGRRAIPRPLARRHRPACSCSLAWR